MQTAVSIPSTENGINRKIWIVLPIFNEASRLPKLLARWEQVASTCSYKIQYVLVNDGSTDGSYEEAVRFGKGRTNVTIINHQINQGLGTTLKDGLRAACAKSADDDLVVVMDSDNTQPPEVINAMIAELTRTDSDVVIASRYQKGAEVEGLSAFRKLMSAGASVLFRTLYPVPRVRDYTCGYRAYRPKVLKAALAAFGEGFASRRGFEISPQILIQLHRVGARFSEVPFTLAYSEKAADSHMQVGSTVKRSLMLILDAWLEHVDRYTEKPFPPRRPFSALQTLSYLALFGLLTTLLIGNWNVRLANTFCDDNPIVYARFFSEPARYLGDAISSFGSAYVYGSSPNLLAGLLYKYLHVPPEIPSALELLLQNLLLPFAVLLLARRVSASPAVRVFAPLFAFAAEVTNWNLANYRNIYFSPYPGHLAIPFLCFAVVSYLDKKYLRTAFWVFLSATIHPILALYTGLILATSTLLTKHSLTQKIEQILYVTLPTLAVAGAIALMLPGSPVAAESIKWLYYENFHLNPLSTQMFWPHLAATVAFMICLIGYGLATLKNLSFAYRRLVLAGLIVCASLSAAHFLAIRFEWLPIMRYSPGRSFSILAVMATPLIASVLVAWVNNRSLWLAICGLELALAYSYQSYGFLWPCLLAGILISRKDSNSRKLGYLTLAIPQIVFVLCAISRFSGVGLAQARFATDWFLPGPKYPVVMAATIFMFAPAMLWAVRKYTRPGVVLAFLVASVYVVGGEKFFEIGSDTYTSELRDLYVAQKWANQNSPREARFLVPDETPWRTFSDRTLAGRKSSNVYQATPESVETDLKVRGVLNKHGVKTIGQLPLDGVNEILQISSADFVVRLRKAPLDLPVAYQNATYVIYKLSR